MKLRKGQTVTVTKGFWKGTEATIHHIGHSRVVLNFLEPLHGCEVAVLSIGKVKV